MSAVKIVTDSTCDLPQELVDQYDIRLIVCSLELWVKSYLDGVELSREEFFQKLPDQNPIPTTSAPGIGTFIESYQQLTKEGATGIISIHISQSLSNIVNIARLATENFTEIPVVVIDSGQLSMGLGLLALAGAKLAASGSNLASVEKTILEKNH